MSPAALWACGWLLASAAFALLWLRELFTQEANVVDAGWAAGLGVLAVFYALAAGGWAPRRSLLALLAGSWSARLAWYLLVDRVLGKPEDARYARLRARWGPRAHRNFFLVFQANALLCALLSIPFLVVCADPRPGLGPGAAAACVLLAVSVAGESAADRRLARFRADPANRGRTCREGLWRYSRHPNYFFEWVHWWAYPALAWGAPGWAWTLLGPGLMLLFLLKLTGVAVTEAHALRSRADYADYQRATSMFIPWPPKRG